MTKQDFINRVLLIMNEAGMADKSGQMFIGADQAQVDKQIEGAYVDAWRRCAKVVSRAWLSNKSFKQQGLVFDKANGTGYVELPSDFYLLSSFKMKGWQKTVHEASVSNDRVMAIQSNEYTRGSEIRPVCVIDLQDVNGVIKHVLRYYSLKKGAADHEVETAIYVPVVKPLKELDKEDDMGISDQIVEPIAYITASTVFTMHEKDEVAKALETRAVQMLPGLESVVGNIVTTKQ